MLSTLHTFAAGVLIAAGTVNVCVAQEQAPRISSVASVGFTVQDLATSVAFYRDVLNFVVISEREELGDGLELATGVFGARRRTCILRLGEETIELSDYLAPEGRPIPADSKSNDHWFQHIAIVVSDMDRAYQHLRAHNVRHASTGPQTLPAWNPNAGGIRAFYFKDPDGHPLEVIWFPQGKGDPKWQGADASKLFLGIDHTAIVVSNTQESLAFYRDVLGLRVAGESENSGTEQEHLNNVFGARLRITGLRAQRGMGVEFLEYIAPTTGRAAPLDAGANDLWHVQIVFDGQLPAQQSRFALSPGATWVSPQPADPDGDGAEPLQVMLRDPDRHTVVIRDMGARTTQATQRGS